MPAAWSPPAEHGPFPGDGSCSTDTGRVSLRRRRAGGAGRACRAARPGRRGPGRTGPDGPASVRPSASTATRAPSWRRSTGPSRSAEMATRPARRPSSTSPGSCPRALHPGGRAPGRRVRTRPGASRCRRPGSPRDPRPATSDSGRVQRRSSQLQCHTSSSGGRRRIGRVQLSGPANGWLTDSSPPRGLGGVQPVVWVARKSIQPTSPSAPACPPSVVTSWPGSSVIPYRRLAAASSAWWLIVL